MYFKDVIKDNKKDMRSDFLSLRYDLRITQLYSENKCSILFTPREMTGWIRINALCTHALCTDKNKKHKLRLITLLVYKIKKKKNIYTTFFRELIRKRQNINIFALYICVYLHCKISKSKNLD
jgi:hypothetical protein